MGLLSSIGKAVKKVFKGVKKVFKKTTKFVGRAMKSKWGKALMLGAAIFFTMGAAGAFPGIGLFGGGGGAAGTGGFFSKFVSGGSNMLQAFTQGGGVATAGAGASGAGGGFLMNAARAAGGFMSSPGGAAVTGVVGNMISGYAQGKAEEERAKEAQRIKELPNEWWRDPAKFGQLQAATNQDIVTPEGMMSRARRVDDYLNARQASFPTQPGDPTKVYGSYVTG